MGFIEKNCSYVELLNRSKYIYIYTILYVTFESEKWRVCVKRENEKRTSLLWLSTLYWYGNMMIGMAREKNINDCSSNWIPHSTCMAIISVVSLLDNMNSSINNMIRTAICIWGGQPTSYKPDPMDRQYHFMCSFLNSPKHTEHAIRNAALWK